MESFGVGLSVGERSLVVGVEGVFWGCFLLYLNEVNLGSFFGCFFGSFLGSNFGSKMGSILGVKMGVILLHLNEVF